MKKSKDQNIEYKVGDILNVKTFAGPVVKQKVLRKINRKSKWTSLSDSKKKEIVEVNGFEGCFVDKRDIIELKNHCVPYTGKEKPSEVESFTFDYHIVGHAKDKKRKRRAARNKK